MYFFSFSEEGEGLQNVASINPGTVSSVRVDAVCAESVPVASPTTAVAASAEAATYKVIAPAATIVHTAQLVDAAEGILVATAVPVTPEEANENYYDNYNDNNDNDKNENHNADNDNAAHNDDEEASQKYAQRLHKPPSTLMTVEERGEGAVSAGMYAAYLNAAKKPVLMALIIASFFVANTNQLLQQWVVGVWTSDVGYVKRPLWHYLAANAATAVGVAMFTWTRTYLGCLFGVAASETLHNNMVKKVLGAPLSFFGESSLRFF